MPRGRANPLGPLCACKRCFKDREKFGIDLTYCMGCAKVGQKADMCEFCKMCFLCSGPNHGHCHHCNRTSCMHAPAELKYCNSCNSCRACCSCFVCMRCGRKRPARRAACLAHSTCADCGPCLVCIANPRNKQALETLRLERKSFVRRTAKPTLSVHGGAILNSERVAFHASSRTEFKMNPLKRFLSVELEVAELQGYKGNPLIEVKPELIPLMEAIDKWHGDMVQDISLPERGFEINTAPANGDKFVQQINEICAALAALGATCENGYDQQKRVQSCGLHVHVDAHDITYVDLHRFLKLYEVVEPILFKMLPGYRRGSHYCLPNGRKYGAMVRAAKPIAPTGRKQVGGRNPLKLGLIGAVYNSATPKRGDKRACPLETRYGALNLHAWFYRGTLEFRQGAGSVEPAYIIPWAELLGTIVDYTVKTPNSTIDKLIKKPDALGQLLLESGRVDLLEFVLSQIRYFEDDLDTKESPFLRDAPRVVQVKAQAQPVNYANAPKMKINFGEWEVNYVQFEDAIKMYQKKNV